MKIPLPDGDSSQDEDSDDDDDDEEGNESPALLWSRLRSWPPLWFKDKDTVQDQRTDKWSHPVPLLTRVLHMTQRQEFQN